MQKLTGTGTKKTKRELFPRFLLYYFFNVCQRNVTYATRRLIPGPKPSKKAFPVAVADEKGLPPRRASPYLQMFLASSQSLSCCLVGPWFQEKK